MRLLAILFALAVSPPLWAGGIQWRSDLESARIEARQTGKLLLMHFFSDQCVWCERLEEGALKQLSVQQTIEDRYIPIKIHGPSNPAWVQAFRVQSYPTDVLLTAEGDIISRQVSPQDPVQFTAMLERPGRPAGGGTGISQSQRSNRASVNLSPPSISQSPPDVDFNSASPGDSLGQMAVSQNPSGSLPENRFQGVSAHGLNPPTNSSSGVPMQGPSYGVAQGAISLNGQIPSTAASGFDSARSNRDIDSNGSNATLLSGNLGGATAKGPMFDGYCPVSMIEHESWVVGKREFGVIHLGEHYYFADLSAQEKFLKSPERYAPVLNGIDIVRFIDERKLVMGTRAFGWTDPEYGRVFLFSSEETANRFNEDFEYYSRHALEIMGRAMADYGR